MRHLESPSRRAALVALAAAALGAACGREDPPPAPPAKSAAAAPPPAPPVRVIPRPENVSVTGVHLGLGTDKYGRVAKATRAFARGDTVVVSVYSDGSAKTATLAVTWKDPGGKVMGEESRTVSYNGSQATPFKLAPAGGLAPGIYKVEVRLDEWLAETASFEVT